MNTPEDTPSGVAEENGAVTATLVQARPVRQSSWLDSVWFDLALALTAGIIYALIVMGPVSLNPRNVDWMARDAAYHYVGWELFRQDPKLHWPLTYTDRIGYPRGESVALLDLNPLLALLLKPLSPLLPEPCQYFGLEAVFACTLQFFFAFRIFRRILGPPVLGIALCSAFFLLSPPLTYRFFMHYSLSNHWLLVAALLVFLRAQQESTAPIRRLVVPSVALAAIAVGINPYIAFQVLLLLTAAVASLLWQRRLTFLRAIAVVGLLGGTCLATAYSLGLVIEQGHGYASGGYRNFSMNLLSPVDPRGWKSVVFHKLPGASQGQYEGYAYFGAGVLVLALIVLVTAFSQRRKLPRLDPRCLVPLLLCCFLLALMAVSTKVTVGSRTLVDLDSGERLSPYLAPLRASGRLFWLPYYVILTAVLVAPFLFIRRLWANLLIAGLLIVQFVDTNALRQWVHATVNQQHPTPLKSPIWYKLGSTHQNLIVLPTFQCAVNASPGGAEGFRIFGYLAVQQKMRTNSYESARFTEVARDYHCGQSVADLTELTLSPNSAYVVTPELAARIAAGPTGPGKCHDLDRFVLCSVNTDFGLSSVLMNPEERLRSAIANPGFEDGDSSPWAAVGGVKTGVSTAQVHSGTHSLAETDGVGSVYQDVAGLEPGLRYTVSAWVSASPGATASARLTIYDPSTNVSASSLSRGPDWQLLTLSFTAGREGMVRLHLFRLGGSGTIYWDDVHVAREE